VNRPNRRRQHRVRGPTRAPPATRSRRRGRPPPSGTTASPDTDRSPLHEPVPARRVPIAKRVSPLQNVPLPAKHPILPPHRRSSSRSSLVNPSHSPGPRPPAPTQLRTAVSLGSRSWEIAGSDRSPWRTKAMTSRLPPRCAPVRSKSSFKTKPCRSYAWRRDLMRRLHGALGKISLSNMRASRIRRTSALARAPRGVRTEDGNPPVRFCRDGG